MPDRPNTPVARQPSGLRERRKQETRLEIADAATQLIAELGMDGTTVEMIAERAGISPRTFFNYFDSKAEAVLARTVDTFAVLPRLLADRPAAEGPLVAVREALCELAAITPPDGSQLRVITDANPAVKAELDRVFHTVGELLKAGLADRDQLPASTPAVAEVAVAVGFALLGLAFKDTIATTPDSGVSPARLREYFDILAAMDRG